MPKLENEAEKVLINSEVVATRSLVTREILGCFGCEKLKSGFTAQNLVSCNQHPYQTVMSFLSTLVKAGILTYAPIDTGRRGRPEHLYQITESEVAVTLKSELQQPEECAL